jgi:hypothetical protein
MVEVLKLTYEESLKVKNETIATQMELISILKQQ